MTLADGKQWEVDEETVVTALVGEDVFVELRLRPEEAPGHFVLYRGDQPIAPERYNVQTRGSVVQLTLKHSSKDDTGRYALVAQKLSNSSASENNEGTRRRLRMNIREATDNPEEGEPPVFVRRLTDLAVKVGTRTRFLVEIRSSSNPKITWHLDDHPIQTGSRLSFVHEGNFFCVDVAPVMVEDQGHWTCMVENAFGRSSCTCCLSVIVPKAYKPPEFVEELRALLTETGTVSLECKVVGVPTPVLRWFKDDKEIKAGDVFALTANADDPTSLGIYTCQAGNCMGTAYSSSKVHVVGRGSREGSLRPADTLVPSGPLPVFKQILKDESCKIGETLTLSCQIQVPPWPRIITWYNKEGKVEASEKYHVMEDGLGTYSVEVRGTEAMDGGEWKCVATSHENVMQFSTCFVAMSIPKNYRVPRFMESLKAVLTEEGLVSFECKVVGFPTPLLRWFKDGQELKPGDVYQLTGTNSLGSYCCIAKNCMGEAKSTAELTVEDIQNQLNEDERLQLMSVNQAPKFIKGLRSCEARIHEDFSFTVQVSISPEPTLSWYRDDEPIIENDKYKLTREVLGTCHLEVHKLEFIDQAEWKCVAANDFGHSVTSCFLKLIIPKHFKKPKFLESLRAILSEEGAVNLECKVIGVPQPVLKWYKDGAELKPGDIHRIISGQDGTCCLGTYTCEATNCMGSVSSSASLLGFEDRVALRKEETTEPLSAVHHELARNLSLSTIHEERTSQLYDTPQTDHSITLDDRGEVSFSFDGKEVSVSLYETPDLTEEEAIQIVEMYADQLSEHITEGNVIELPPMRFMKETSTTGNLLMEAVVIDVSPDYFADEEADDLRTEADVEDVSIMDDQLQSMRSSFSTPPAEHSGEQTPVGSPPPRPPRRKERSGSASSKSEKSEKREKVMDWSESYHSAKEPSVQAQLSLQSQDSVDAFADALSSEGLARVSPREFDMPGETVPVIRQFPVALLHSPELTEEVFAAALRESIEESSSVKKKKRKRRSKNGTPMLSSKTSSEESYTMDAEAYETEGKVKRRGSKEEKRERKDSSGSVKSNKSSKGKKKRKSQDNQQQSLKIEAIRLETSEVFETPDDDNRLAEERPSSTASSVFTTAGDISDQSMSKSQKERLYETVSGLTGPVLILRETLVDLEYTLSTWRDSDEGPEKIQSLIIDGIVRPVENLCEQMSVIERKAVKAAGDRSLAQGIRISLLDSIGGPTEELLRGVELIKSRPDKTPDDLKSDFIVLESLTDPVDEILAGLAKIEHELKSKEGPAESVPPRNPIILEKMTRTISRLGINVEDLLRSSQKTAVAPEVVAIAERLDSVYQNLDSFLQSLTLDKITGMIESNVDTLVLETLIRPLENLVQASSQSNAIDLATINHLQKSISDVKNKLETLVVALETYGAESGDHGVTESNLELVNYLKWTMDDTSDKLLKLKNSKKIQETKIDDDMPGSVPVSSDEEWKLDQEIKSLEPQKIEEIITPQLLADVMTVMEETTTPIAVEAIPEPLQIESTSVPTPEEEAGPISPDPERLIHPESSSQDGRPAEELDAIEFDEPKGAKSKREKYKRGVTSIDSAPAELDETLPLPEMLLDPLIDAQAKLNAALRHYENQNPTDESSFPLTELSNCVVELRDSIASAAHVATSLNVSDTLNSIMDLREPLLDLQLALSTDPSPQELILVEEITQPLQEVNGIVSAVVRSPTTSESSNVILKQVSRMVNEILDQLPVMSGKEMATALESQISEVEARSPPDDVERVALAFTSVHFALSSVLENAKDHVVPAQEGTAAQSLVSSIQTLQESLETLSATISNERKYKFNTNAVLEEVEKLQEPLSNFQIVLLTQEHQPEERHILYDVSNPLKALKDAVSSVSQGQVCPVLDLLEDVEKDVSLVAMDALKKALVGTIPEEDHSTFDSTPGEVSRIISKWFYPIENWLMTTPEGVIIEEKENHKSAVVPVVDELKKQLLKVATQSAYSEPPSNVALIENLAELREPLSRVCEFITNHHEPVDIEVIESLSQPTRHLIGIIVDTSATHQASSVLRPVLDTLEELENQISLSIRMAKYELELQEVVKSMTSEELDQAEKSSHESVENLRQEVIADEHQPEHLKSSSEDENIVAETKSKALSFAAAPSSQEEDQRVADFKSQDSEVEEDELEIIHKAISPENIPDLIKKLSPERTEDNSIVEEELLKRRQSDIASAAARAEELDLWTLTILGPLDRLASTALALDRSIDEEVHTLLCRPLDSLHKQIELVESQINRPAGQSFDKDVETIIEGFLSPANHVETALKTAVDIWHKAPAKEAVRAHLQKMVESTSELCQRLDSLKCKLITEAPVQIVEVQKSEASLVETISAVLAPLEGIKKVISNMLEETLSPTVDLKLDETVDTMRHEDHIVEESASFEESSEFKSDAKKIERTTAKPLKELIEAIVDPAGVRNTSTSPDGIKDIEVPAESNIDQAKEMEKTTGPEAIEVVTGESKIEQDQIAVDKDSDAAVRDTPTCLEGVEDITPAALIIEEDKIAADQDLVTVVRDAPTAPDELKDIETSADLAMEQGEMAIVGDSDADVKDISTALEALQDVEIPAELKMEQDEVAVIEDSHAEVRDISTALDALQDIETPAELIIKQDKMAADKDLVDVMRDTPTSPDELKDIEIAAELKIEQDKMVADKDLVDVMRDTPTSPDELQDIEAPAELKMEQDGVAVDEDSHAELVNISTALDALQDVEIPAELKMKQDGIALVKDFDTEAGDTSLDALKDVESLAELTMEQDHTATEKHLETLENKSIEIVSPVIDETVHHIEETSLKAVEEQRGNLDETVDESRQISDVQTIPELPDLIMKELMVQIPQELQESIPGEMIADIKTEEIQEVVQPIDSSVEAIHESEKSILLHTSTESPALDEALHDLVVDELQEQKVEPSRNEDLMTTVEEKIQDVVLQYPAPVEESNFEEVIHDVVPEVHESQVAVSSSETLRKLDQLKTKILETKEELTVFDTTMLTNRVKDITKSELDRQNALSYESNESLMKNILSSVQEKMEKCPQICQDNIFEESVRDIVEEELHKVKELESEMAVTSREEPSSVHSQEKAISTAEQFILEPEIATQAAETSLFQVPEEKIHEVVVQELQNLHVEPSESDALTTTVETKMKEIILAAPEELQENNLVENIHDLVATEFQKAKSVEEDNLIAADEIRTKVEVNVPDPVQAELIDSPTTVHVIGNIQETLVEPVEEKIQQSICPQQLKESVPENIVQSHDNMQQQKVEAKSSEVIEDMAIANVSQADIKLDKVDKDTKDEEKLDINQVMKNLEIEKPERAALEASPEDAREGAIDDSSKKVSEQIEKASTPFIEVSGPELIIAEPTVAKEEFTNEHIQELITHEIDKQGAKLTVDDVFIKATTAKIQQIIINNPKESTEKILEANVHDIIVEEVDKLKARVLETEGLVEVKAREVKVEAPKLDHKSEIPEEFMHELVMEEVHKQSVAIPAEEENLVSIVEKKIKDLIAEHPEVCEAHIIEEKVHDLVAEAVDHQKAVISESEALAKANKEKLVVEGRGVTSAQDIPEEHVHELVVGELQKQHVQPSDTPSLSKAIETKVQELISQHPEVSQPGTLEESVHDITTQILKERKINVIESEDLFVAEEAVHDLIVEKIHQENLQPAVESVLLKAVESRIKHLIAQHPEMSREEVVEDNVHEIIIEELNEQKAKVLESEKLSEAEKQEIKVEPPKSLPRPPVTGAVIKTIIDKVLLEQNINPAEKIDMAKAIGNKIEKLIAENSELSASALEASAREIADEEIKILKTEAEEMRGQQIIDEHHDKSLETAVEKEIKLSEERVRDIIDTELHKLNISSVEEGNLSTAIESKIQGLLAHPEVSTEDSLQESIKKVIVDQLKEQKAVFDSTSTVKEANKTPTIFKSPSAAETNVPEEIVHDLIIEELHEQNVSPSEEAKLSKAVEMKVQDLIAHHPGLPSADLRENVHQIVVDELKEQEFSDSSKPSAAQEEVTKPGEIETHPVAETERLAEIVHDMVIEELQKQKQENMSETVEAKVHELIKEHPEISTEELRQHKIQQVIQQVLTDESIKQKATITEPEQLSAIADQEKQSKVTKTPLAEVTTSKEMVHDLVIEELHKVNADLLEEANLCTKIEAEVQKVLVQQSEPPEEDALRKHVQNIVKHELKEKKAQIFETKDAPKAKKGEISAVDFKTPSTAQTHVPEEMVHELVIEELHKQNVQPSEESNLVKAIEHKLQDLIAQHPEVCKDAFLEESVRDIVTEKLEEEKATILEAGRLENAKHQRNKIEVLNVPASTHIQAPEEMVHEMVIDECHKQNIEPSSEENLVKAVEAKVRHLIAQHPEICKDDILEGSVRDIITETRAEQKANIIETDSLAKASQQNVQVEVLQQPKASVDASKQTLEAISQPLKDPKNGISPPTVQELSKEKCGVVTDPIECQKNEQSQSAQVKMEPVEENKRLSKEELERPAEVSTTQQRNESGSRRKREVITDQADLQLKPQPQATPINPDFDLDSEVSESSKSTLRDLSFDERPRQNIPPMIEIGGDDSGPRDPSSRRSNVSSKRYKDQSYDPDDKSIGVYSSTTSRIQGFSPGPRDRGKKPSFCTKLTDRTAAEASRIKLTCTVLGEPDPEVYWLKDGKPLAPSSNKHCTTMEYGMASLELYAVTPKDSGEYSCIAANVHGRACTEAKLKVYAGYEATPTLPTFTRSIKDTYRPDEKALVLECRVRAQPPPTIVWLKDGQVLDIGDRYQQSDLADGICRLKIFSPDFHDSGLYTCRAENDTRLSDRTSQLITFGSRGKIQLGAGNEGRVQSAASWRSSSSYHDITSTDKDTRRPRFSSYLTDHSVPAGGTIALQVEVKGVPAPDITWMKADKRGSISVPKARTFADSGVYTLIVPDATELETGTYVCRASNAYGHVDTTANVEVVAEGTMDGGKPAMFVSRPPDKIMIVAVGEDVSVSFRTTGIPKPRVVWMKGLRDITCGPRSYKEGHDDYVRLTLKRACPSDEGTYCILVKNRYGCDRSFFTVQVKQRARSLTPSPDWGPGDTDNLLANIHDKERSYQKQVPGPISSEPVVVDGGRNWLALTWGKAEQRGPAPVVAYRVDAWLLGGDGGARWAELGVTPINAFDAFNLRPGEEYKFRVTPRNRYGWGEPVTMSNSVTVREVVKFPEFTKILPGQLKALSGTVINLDCEVASDSMAHVKWYQDTTEIENGQESRFTTYFNGNKCTLMIGSISASDCGRYVCEATNAAGRVSTFARVQVVDDPKIVEADLKLRKLRSSDTANEERPPEFTMRLRDRRVQASYPVRLTCQATGYPEPEVTWYKYREELFPQDNVAIWNDEAHFHTLEISRSTIDDSGVYMAKAKNAFGSVSCRCHLVVDKGIRAYIAPEFFGHLDQVYTVKAGGELRMTAQVEAYPTVGITWHRDGHRLRPSRDVIMTLNHDGTVELELAHVTPRDAGVYCCTATNEVGRAESSTRVTVLETGEDKNFKESVPDVIESPDIPYSKEPLFVTKPLSTEAFEGDTVIILCEVVGDPKPEVIWLRDFLRPDYYKDAPHFRRVGAGPQYRLEIPYAKFDFTGTYSIIAKNCHGEAKAVISLQIYARGQGKEDNSMESTIKHGNVQTLPVIKRPLRDLRCCDGDAVTFVCKVRATPEPNVRWERGGKLVPLGNDFATDYDGETARLSIQHVYPEDEGEYTCVAYNNLGKAYTSACLIVDVPEGKETAISRRLIKPPGLLSPNSTPISTPRSTPVRSLSPSMSRRELKPVARISRGQVGGRRPRMPTGPKFYAVPHNRVAEEGETVRFQCAVAGHPAPWVTWDKDGVSVTPTARISLKEKDDVRILEIIEVTHEDAGLYRVTLENDVGRTEATARLEIIRGRHGSVSRSIGTRSASPRTYSMYGRSHISPSPRLDSRLQPPRLGDSGRGGTISPTLPRWHHRNGQRSGSNDSTGKNVVDATGNKMRSSSIPRRSSSEGAGSLTKFRKAQTPEALLRKEPCSKNVTSEADRKTPPGIKPPVILAAPADVIALRGTKVTLLATYEGNSTPIVRWLRKGQSVTLDDRTEIETSAGLTRLTLANVTTEEAGKYEVHIENLAGRDSKYVNVTVEGPPEPPGKPTAQGITRSGTITLTWTSPVYDGGCAVTGYSVEMRRGDEPCWVAVAEARHSLSHTVHQLESEESYRFRVRAENIHGASEPGLESDVCAIPSGDGEDMTSNAFGLVSEVDEEDNEVDCAFEPRHVVPEPGYYFNERYNVLEELGKGRYGFVRRIVDKESKMNLAAKIVRTVKSRDRKQALEEINIMNTLRHPKLLKLVAAFENPKEMIMVMEYISGGELFERVVADDFTLTEKDSILFVRQICQGVDYMHDNCVVHLDLKPENIMCQTRTSHKIKLIDFGLAQTLSPDTPVRVLFGTPEFIPPEIIGFEPIGTESDMWSVGVICYVLLTGLSPFMGEDDAETFANITRADYDFDDKAFHAISQEAKDFISALLVKRKELRMSAKECLEHPWLAQCAENMSRVALPTDKLKKFIVRRKWQKTGNAIRALGRMATLSASRKNTPSNPPSPKPFEDLEKEEILGELNLETADHLAHPSPVDSPEDVESNEIAEDDDLNNESIDEVQSVTIDISLNEYFDSNSNGLDTESPTVMETQRSFTPEDSSKVDSNSFKAEETDSTASDHICDESNVDFTTEFIMPTREALSDNDETPTTLDVRSTTLVNSSKNQEDNDLANLPGTEIAQVNDPPTENKMIINQDETKSETDKATEESSCAAKKLTRPSFIDLSSPTNTFESVSKPWFKTNSPPLDNEDEVSRLRKQSPLQRGVRTGCVSRTAKIFEQEEASSPSRQTTSPGGRIILPTSDARPQNERIRKAFAFWNK